MKKTIIITLTAMLFFATGNAQNATIDNSGNYVQISGANVKQAAKPTGKTFTTSKGEKLEVFITDKQKLFVIRTSAKTQKQYRMYLKL